MSKDLLNADYHCIIHPQTFFNYLFKTTKEENLKIIRTGIKNNILNIRTFLTPLILENTSKNMAITIDSDALNVTRIGKNFVYEDHFSETTGVMIIHKDICCKNMIEAFIHRLITLGLYFKYHND